MSCEWLDMSCPPVQKGDHASVWLVHFLRSDCMVEKLLLFGPVLPARSQSRHAVVLALKRCNALLPHDVRMVPGFNQVLRQRSCGSF
jgi:hypothetical protein